MGDWLRLVFGGIAIMVIIIGAGTTLICTGSRSGDRAMDTTPQEFEGQDDFD